MQYNPLQDEGNQSHEYYPPQPVMVQNAQQLQPVNYQYPGVESINQGSRNPSQLGSNIVQGAVVIDIQEQELEQVKRQEDNGFPHNQNYPEQPNYMEQPYMGIPVMAQQNYQQQAPPLAPPPPPQLQNFQQNNSLNAPLNLDNFEVRDIKEIEECRHNNPQKYLYISSPKILLSIIIIAFYIVGVISLIVGVIILIIVAVIAMSDNKGGCDCKIDSPCKDCNLCCLGGGGRNGCGGCFCDICLRSSIDICCYNPSTYNMYNITYGYDYSYYRYRYHRKNYYHDYHGNQSTGCCESLSRCLYEVFCCSCCDSINLGSATDSCMVNKVEVYCTNCNSKLREEWTGTKHIAPSLLLGIFGVIILVVSILLLQHYNVD